MTIFGLKLINFPKLEVLNFAVSTVGCCKHISHFVSPCNSFHVVDKNKINLNGLMNKPKTNTIKIYFSINRNTLFNSDHGINHKIHFDKM